MPNQEVILFHQKVLVMFSYIVAIFLYSVPSFNVDNNCASHSQQTKIVYSRDQLLCVNKTTHCPVSAMIYKQLKANSILRKKNKKRGCRGGVKRRIRTVCGRRNLPKQHRGGGVNHLNLTKIDTRNFLIEHSNKCKIMYFNSHSVCNKTVTICDLILESNTEMVFITETWLTGQGDDSIKTELTPRGFQMYSNPRRSRIGGGVCVIYRNGIKLKPEDIRDYSSFECLKVTAFDMTFLCIYHPPPSKENKSTNRIFIDEFLDLLDKFSSNTGQLVILGDINLHFDSMSDTYTQSAKSIINNHGLKQLVTSPTHEKGHILDWVITREEPNSVKDLKVLDKALSDHFVIIFSLDSPKPPQERRTMTTRNIKLINSQEFCDTLKSTLLGPPVPDVETQAELYVSNLKAALNQHAPAKTRTILNRPSAPWYTLEVKQAKQKRRAAERKWKKSKLTVDKQIYKFHVNAVKELIVYEKKKYLNEKIASCKSSQALFNICNEMRGNTKSPTLPSHVPISKLPKKFGDFFVNKIYQIRSVFNNSNEDESDKDILEPFSGNTFNIFRPVSSYEIRKIILSSPTKSCLLDPIPTSLLVECLDPLLETITGIINSSLTSSTVPSQFKEALVTPLLKKKGLDSDEFKNYRPVSNLPFISKILEKVVLAQLKEHLQINNLIDPFQSAYRENHSTETALIRVVNDVLRSIDNGDIAILTFLDLSSAFDTIDHSILLKRLNQTFGISGQVLNWFQSYLTNRCQSVIIQEFFSDKFHLEFGVPQGSVLGPVLYTLYASPLAAIFRKHNIHYHMYADDSQLYKCVQPNLFEHSITSLQHCCESVKCWMSKNKLKLNDEKTEIMLCSTSAKLNQINIEHIRLVDANIPLSDKVKNLGVFFDQTLCMEHQVNHIVRSMYFEIRRISRIKHFLNCESIKTLVTTFVLSRLDYCNSLLAGLTEERISKLQRAQNCAARLVLGRSKYENSKQMLITLHWLPVRARIEFKIACLCFKSLESTTPTYIQEIFVPYVPQRALRSKDFRLLVEPRCKLKTFGDRSLSKIGPHVWNSIPLSLRSAETTAVFKRGLKTYLFKKYLY